MERRVPSKVWSRRREIAFLRLEGKSNKEISEISGIPLRTVQRDIKYVREHINEFNL